MSIKISELPVTATIVGTEVVPLVQEGVTKQVTVSDLRGPPAPAGATLGANTFTGSQTISGPNALRGSYGSGGMTTNVAIGDNALVSNTTGGNTTAVGVWALNSSTTPYNNTAIGAYALQRTTTGEYNVAVGNSSLSNNIIGRDNVAVGSASASQTRSNFNVAVGSYSLFYNVSQNYSTAIGYQALFNNTAFANCTGLGANSAVTGSNQVQLGDAATTTYVYGTVQNRSDLRDKTDIQNTTLGLAFIQALRPVDYRWDLREDYKPVAPAKPTLQRPLDETAKDYAAQFAAYEAEQTLYTDAHENWLVAIKLSNITSDGSKKRTRLHHGFIAQEVLALNANFGGVQDHAIKGGEDVLSLGYDELIAPIVKAIQELKDEFDAYKLAHP